MRPEENAASDIVTIGSGPAYIRRNIRKKGAGVRKGEMQIVGSGRGRQGVKTLGREI